MTTEEHEHQWFQTEIDEQDGVEIRHYECKSADCGVPRTVRTTLDGAEPVTPGAVVEVPLGDWWMEVASVDLAKFWPKLKEYGAHDLLTVGAGMMPHGTDQQRLEAGIAFYLLGKVGRMVGAYMEGRSVSDDTLLDLSVYSMMARRVRATGELA